MPPDADPVLAARKAHKDTCAACGDKRPRTRLRDVTAVTREAELARVRGQIATALSVNPQYQSALRDAESESWDEPGVEGAAMIEAASARRQALS